MKNNPQEDIALIRSMMERSTRFISLSGLSGVFAGVFGLMAALGALWVLKTSGIEYFEVAKMTYPPEVVLRLFLICIFTLAAAIGIAFFFTYRKSKRYHQKFWDKNARRFVFSLGIPLAAGGILCLALFVNGQAGLITPSMLIFYGLALVNAEKYTYSDIGYLGYCELILGLISAFIPGYGLLFWAGGFGALHIIYGLVMYKKYQ